ncbi:MAG: hypothetical protein LBP80_08655 [Treponema sp.]|nr:hypothetical protein [Treponema sp.]
MRYVKFRFCIVLFGIGIIFLAIGGCAGGSAPAPVEPAAMPAAMPAVEEAEEEDDVWALLDRGETGRAKEFFLDNVDINSRSRTPLHAVAEAEPLPAAKRKQSCCAKCRSSCNEPFSVTRRGRRL